MDKIANKYAYVKDKITKKCTMYGQYYLPIESKFVKNMKNVMVTIKEIPLSVNRAWQGRRFKTPEYKNYEEVISYLLPRTMKIPEKGKLKIHYVFGFSNKASDNDNPVKPLQDILCKRYNFNDNRIYKTVIEKIDVKKGQEFIKFNITALV